MDLNALEKLNELKEKGILTEQEFQDQKAKMLSGHIDAPRSAPAAAPEIDARSYATLMHCAQFAGFLLPMLGLVVPVVMWLYRKDRDAYINQQGKVVMNWILTELIAAAVCWVLVFLVIGIPLFIVLFVCSVVFTIQGALRARDGIVRNYPLSIKFFSLD